MNTTRDYREWTQAEEERLTELLAAGLDLEACARKLGRSYKGIQCKLDRDKHLRPGNAPPRSAWSEDEDRELQRLFSMGIGRQAVAARLGRSVKAVASRARRLAHRAASTRGQMGRPPAQAPTKPPPRRITTADEMAAARRVHEARVSKAVANGDLWEKWKRWNDAVAKRGTAQ